MKCVHFQRERRKVIWVSGWPWKEGLTPCLGPQHPPPRLGLQGFFPFHEGRGPREGERELSDPVEGQRRRTLCLEMSA